MISIQQYLIFSLSSRLFASRLRDVKRVLPLEKIFDVPLKRNNFEGLVKFEGKAIPLFNLKRVVVKQFNRDTQENLIVVQNVQGQDVGFLIDKVHKVAALDRSSFEDYESQLPGVTQKSLWEGSEVIVIEAEKLLLNAH